MSDNELLKEAHAAWDEWLRANPTLRVHYDPQQAFIAAYAIGVLAGMERALKIKKEREG